jgi:hypothetical protein
MLVSWLQAECGDLISPNFARFLSEVAEKT